ncbi:MAG: hypothetical protein LC802_09580 [Acidobacteria bacterium]|nr:hypothetical protein [Acidobacteriota bacterium]
MRLGNGYAGARGLRVRVLCAVLLAVLLVCVGVAAQSGRRGQKPAATPQAEDGASPVGPTPKPSPAAGAGTKRDLKGVKLLVAAEIKSDTTDRARVIFDNCIVHLADAGAAVNSLGLLKRELAVKRAQSETEAYVVWLQLEKDSFQNGNVVLNSPDLVVKYTVYAPRTGESKAKGKVFYQAMAGPRGRAGSSDPVKITAEAAGIEAADRVIDWFTLSRHPPQLERP